MRIDELKAELEVRQNREANPSYIMDFHKDMQENPRGTMNSNKYSKEAIISNLYGDENTKRVEELQNLIRDKEAYYNQAERVQNAYKLASVSDPESENYDPNFEEYAEYVENYFTNPSFEDAQHGKGVVRNPVKFTRDNYDKFLARPIAAITLEP